jgi:hypothetical protein
MTATVEPTMTIAAKTFSTERESLIAFMLCAAKLDRCALKRQAF